MERIYLDNNATTPLDPQVFKAMVAEFSGPPANPSSIHWFGQRARALLNHARQEIASFFEATPEEITFTSCGTESLNLVLRGLGSEGHLITTSIEHSSVYKTIRDLEKQGLSVTYLPVGLWGAPLPEQVEKAIRPETQAMVFSAANGETGVKLDLESIATLAEKHQIPLLLDAVAYLGKEPLPLYPGISAIAFSAHKFHGPKGVGALFARSPLKFSPILTGGNQEYQRRAGTENLAGILGLAEAIRILKEEGETIAHHLSALRHHFEHGLKAEISDFAINGEGPRISNTANIAFLGLDGETLLMQLDMVGIAASHGSACSSGALEPSRVLTEMGIDRATARSSLRFSLSRMNTREEVERALFLIAKTVKALRKIR